MPVPANHSCRRRLTWLGLASILLPSTGCALVHKPPHAPVPANVPAAIPRELSKATTPVYVIEPPDVLTISSVSLIPRHPYRIRPLDTLLVQASGVPTEAPIGGEYVVGLDGNLILGFDYDYLDGRFQPVRAVGKTIEQIRAELHERLRLVARDPKIWITLASIASQQEISGEHLVAPDGRVTLGSYGRVCLVGMTIEEAKLAIEAHLSQYFEYPQVSVDVFGYNSKVYYVITQGAGLGDQVVRLPITGNETALDAIAEIQGLSSTSSIRMWVARPGFNQQGGDQIMPVDWLGITQRGDVSTNYQIMPGDRIYVAEDCLVAIDTTLAKIISPIERVLGVTILGTSAANGIDTFGQSNGNGVGNGFVP